MWEEESFKLLFGRIWEGFGRILACFGWNLEEDEEKAKFSACRALTKFFDRVNSFPYKSTWNPLKSVQLFQWTTSGPSNLKISLL